MRHKLQAARMDAGLSQKDAGALIGRTQSHYGKIERGDVMIPADDALTLCHALKIDLADLLERDDILSLVCSRHYGDTMHVLSGNRTLCNRDASEWPRLEPMHRDKYVESAYACTRCAAKLDPGE